MIATYIGKVKESMTSYLWEQCNGPNRSFLF